VFRDPSWKLHLHVHLILRYVGDQDDPRGGVRWVIPEKADYWSARDAERWRELLYFDESGFSPNPPVQYGWGRIGKIRVVEPLTHRQRVNVLGALRHDGQLTWATQQRPTTRGDVIAFFDQIALVSHSVPHRKSDRLQWAKHGLYLYYFPPYSPELNRIILRSTNYRYPEIMGCESGCLAAAGGWPAPYLVDYPGISPVGSVSLTDAMLGMDNVWPAELALTFIFWLALSALVVWLLGRKGWRRTAPSIS
jgi:hypothetical protein